jgi:Icc-related predicted phosphoesterase
LIGGNHDFYLHSAESKTINDILGPSCHYLRDEIVEIEGRTFLGIPWCSNLPRWAFNMDEDVLDEHLQKLKVAHDLANKKIDLLILHAGPKIGNMGKSLDRVVMDIDTGLYGAPEYGNEALAKFVQDVVPQYVINGHLHSSEHGKTIINNGKTFGYGVSYLGEDYRPKYKPLVLDL